MILYSNALKYLAKFSFTRACATVDMSHACSLEDNIYNTPSTKKVYIFDDFE